MKSNHEVVAGLDRNEPNHIVNQVIELLVVDMLHISAKKRPSASMLLSRIHSIMENYPKNADSDQKLAETSKSKEDYQGEGLSPLSSTSRKKRPLKHQSDEVWRYDEIEAYQLTPEIINQFLKSIFGRYKFFIEVGPYTVPSL